jgi:hypothetical protein
MQFGDPLGSSEDVVPLDVGTRPAVAMGMKKTRRRAEKRETSSRHGDVQNQREAAATTRDRDLTTTDDLMWGDEGIDDPPAQS